MELFVLKEPSVICADPHSPPQPENTSPMTGATTVLNFEIIYF
jgi:hypothetical protein